MYKTPSCDIHASFLVPAYNLPAGTLSYHITTIENDHDNGNTKTDVWLINASEDNPTKSMIASLRKEKNKCHMSLKKELAKTEPTNDSEKTPKVRELERSKAMFADLVTQAQDPVCQKQPDEHFLKIAHSSFTRAGFSSCQPDLQNYLYLTKLANKHEER